MTIIRVNFSALGYERLGFLTSDAQVPAKSNLYSKSNAKEIKISCILFISIAIDEQKYNGAKHQSRSSLEPRWTT